MDNPKTWGEMTDAEKGALLLAHHEGKVIEALNTKLGEEWFTIKRITWNVGTAYRVKPEPVRETVEILIDSKGRTYSSSIVEREGEWSAVAKISYERLDGEPICDSIRMEKR